MNAPLKDDLVILVHGTFAAQEVDEGDDWWQRGSPVWEQLEQRLPSGVSLPEKAELFHWSGDNTERARANASRELLSYLQRLEAADNQSYHLIGHSHGGSVIWGALRCATLEKQPLSRLRSWATVGTPFLHLRTRSAWSIVNFLNIAVAVFFLNYAAAAVMRLFEVFATAIMNPSKNIEFKIFNPDKDVSVVEHILMTPQGWLTISGILLLCFISMQLGGLFLGPVVESRRMRKEKRIEHQAMKRFGDRWLGIWSPDDEAINGLRATLHLSMTFVSHISRGDRTFSNDKLSVLSLPYYWTIAPTFNWLLRPYLDRVVRSYVTKSAQGNNRPSAEVIEVSVGPVLQDAPDYYPPIPPDLNQQIVDTADDQAGDIAPKLRKLLGESSIATGLESFSHTLTGRELVHTSYFDSPDILDLLAMHIALEIDAHDELQQYEIAQPELHRWLRRFKRRVTPARLIRHSRHDQPSKPKMKIPLAKPRRRAA